MEELSVNDVNERALAVAKKKDNGEKEVSKNIENNETDIDNTEFTFSHKPTPLSKSEH